MSECVDWFLKKGFLSCYSFYRDKLHCTVVIVIKGMNDSWKSGNAEVYQGFSERKTVHK